MSQIIKVNTYRADEIISFKETNPLPGLPKFCNIHFYPAHFEDSFLKGPGLYIVCFDGKPLYLGKYLGLKADPFSGNILKLRWIKHLATLTLRGKRISLSKRTQDIVSALDDENVIIQAFRNGVQELIHNDRGCVTTAPRLIFANDNWQDFLSLDNSIISRFTFTYLQLQPSVERTNVAQIREHISSAEVNLLIKHPLKCNIIAKKNNMIENDLKLQELVDSAFLELSTSDERTVQNVSQNKAISCGKNPNIEEREINGFETQLENTDGWASEFIADLMSYFENVDDVEAHYTLAGGGDLRLRVFWNSTTGIYRSQNFAVIQWLKSKRIFLIKTEAVARDIRDLKMRVIDDTLPAALKVTEDSYRNYNEKLMHLLINGSVLIKARQNAFQL